jgi:hypothetical protein
MAEDIRQGFKESKERAKALKTFTQVQKDYDGFIQNNTDRLQKRADKIQINLDSATISRKIKEKTSNSFEELIDLVSQTNTNPTSDFFIGLLQDQLQNLPTLIENIIQECVFSSLNCSNEQTFLTNQELYIQVSEIDLFNQLKLNPNSSIGASIYEKTPYEQLSSRRSTNRFLYELIQTPSVPQVYYGSSGQELFKISFETFNGVTQGNYFKVVLYQRINAPNRVTDFIIDYYKTIKMLDFNNAVNKIVDLILNITKFNSNTGPSKYNDWLKFTRILERILGMCFDSNEEIDVGGISKYPENDDVTDTFFEFTPNEISQIENEISIIRQGYVEFIDCNNVQLPISEVDYVFDTISEVNEDGSNINSIFQDIYFNLSNDDRWQLQGISLDYAWNQGIIKNFVKGAMMSILSPKVLLPFVVMSKALSTTVSNLDDNIVNDIEANSPGMMQFAKQNKKMIICATSKIGALFVEALYLQLKQDIIRLVRAIILDLSRTKNEMKINAIKAILDNTEAIIRGVVNLVNDYRSCKSLINSIFNLLKLTPIPRKYILPTPFLYLTEYLPGVLPQKEVVEYILQMQRLGIPTGPGINGEPDLGTLEKIAVFTASFNERTKNGKVEGVIVTETISPTGQPTGNVRVTGKYF